LFYHIAYLFAMEVQIQPEWKAALGAEFEQPYFQQLAMHLKLEKSAGKIIYPPGALIFNAFAHTPLSKVKVVILGQDPYHGPNQAMGLCFSVPKGIDVPPSLQNIYKELHADIGLPIPSHGDLTPWADNGVLLLNAALTVRANDANSHASLGWHQFTDSVIRCISANRRNVVFLLWGKFAQQKRALINMNDHKVLQAAHPSPLSAYNGFFGCRHFSQTNNYLQDNGIEPVDWFIP